MSIIIFFTMSTIVLFTYITQFLIVREWILDYEKENIKLIYDQVQVLSIDVGTKQYEDIKNHVLHNEFTKF